MEDKKYIFCANCGEKIGIDDKFCRNCGTPVKKSDDEKVADETKEHTNERQTVYEGKLHKCPNCGEVLESFTVNCPACDYEIRSTKAASSVKDFSLKLEEIEAKREKKKHSFLFGSLDEHLQMSRTDEQKINLIKSFPVPNSREDMLEFMILATSNVNTKVYDSTNTNMTKGEIEETEAWLSKARQIYEKAKISQYTDDTFTEIKSLYDDCNKNINKSKKKGVVKWVCIFGWLPILFIIIMVLCVFVVPRSEANEVERLEQIVTDVQEMLEIGEYKSALRIADTIDYHGNDDETGRKWSIEKEYWIDKVLEDALINGVYLEYTLSEDATKPNDSSY